MSKPSIARREWGVPRLSSPHAGVRLAAIELGLITGWPEAWAACLNEVRSRGEGYSEAILLLALVGDEPELKLVLPGMAEQALRAHVLWALGFSGWPSAAEACLAWLGDRQVGALAGESFTAITGVRLKGDHVLAQRADRVRTHLAREEMDLSEDLTLRPEDGLPVLASQPVSSWWSQARRHFDRRARYLRGRTYDAALLFDALAREPMRRRHVLAREARVRSRGRVHLRSRGMARAQYADLERAAVHTHSLRMAPYGRL